MPAAGRGAAGCLLSRAAGGHRCQSVPHGLDEAAELLVAGRGVRGRGRKLVKGAVSHALAFSTWRSLATNGIGRPDAVGLTTALVEAAGVSAAPAGPRAGRSTR